MTGLKRNLQEKIESLLGLFPVVVILGARQTGKTTLAKQVAPDWYYLDLEKPSHYEQLSYDPEFFFEQHPDKVIIDEAQFYPQLFSILRGVIDEKRGENGRFIITGSSSFELLQQSSESLAGRVAIVELGTLKVNEYYQQPLSHFYQLFQTNLNKTFLDDLTQQSSCFSTEQVQTIWLKGGYPQPLLSESDIYYQQWMENYQATYINRDIAALFPKLNKVAYQRFLSMLSKLSSTILNKSEIARAIEVSESVIRQYLTIAEGSFIWRQLLSYEKNITKSIVKMPKGYMRDNGLLHFLLKINSLESLYLHPIVGHSFEGFVIEELIKGLQATMITNWQAKYYRTRNGAEVDLILDGPFGVLPIEIKYGSNVPLKKLRGLQSFVQEHQLPFGLVLNQATSAKWLTREIYQLPVGYL